MAVHPDFSDSPRAILDPAVCMSDQVELNGKTALVTGAAKRLGAATALALARAGVAVVLHYRQSETEVNNTAEEIAQTGAKVWTVQADFSNSAEGERCFRQAKEAAGAIDFLINSASLFAEQGLDEFSFDDLALQIQVNAFAPLELARAFVAQDMEGAMVNFLDARMADYDRKHVPYHLSKRMLHALTQMMAVEYAPKIRVNAVAPGLVLPPEGEDEAYLRALHDSNPLNRHGSADGVVEAVLFLLRSGFITGQTIFVDGGRHLRGAMYG
jgi:pteridine reductase